MRRYGKQFWRQVPLLRLLIPVTAGILIQDYFSVPIRATGITAMVSVLTFLLFHFLPIPHKFRYREISGITINLCMVCIGAALMYYQNTQNKPYCIAHFCKEKETLLITVKEPLTGKTNSFKTIAQTRSVFKNGHWQSVKGDIIVYFAKDSLAKQLQYGSQLLIQANIHQVTNTGNPGGFDYKRYCASQNIYGQVYLNAKNYTVLKDLKKNPLTEQLILTRNLVLDIFRKWVPGQKEAGVAEALLIGYRDDLDKELVQSYSNTGVVHIIAISGLHLGMIYGLMLLILKPFRKTKWIRFIKPIAILSVLWGFSLLAGAAPSILRSAVMFSFIVIGESLGRKTNIYNTLAASALCLLIYNPYFFWDVGFQLSYAAVLSIILFMQPIYKQIWFPNKLLNTVWQLNAVTLSAQVLTLPIILYYFHQFPNLFLFTNFVAVPLSGFILYAELCLLFFAPIPYLNAITGKIISFLIGMMDTIIEKTNRIPFAVTDNIRVDLIQTLLLYCATGCFTWWLFEKQKKAFLTGLLFMATFFMMDTGNRMMMGRQQKLIVYNIPKRTAIDLINGLHFSFIGDSDLYSGSAQARFYLNPSRIRYRVTEKSGLPGIHIQAPLIAGRQKTVLILNREVYFPPVIQQLPVDIIILSGNPKIYLSRLAAVFDCKQYVFDSSNPLWKIERWKKDADSLHLRHHSVSEQGAFETDL